MKTLTAYTKNGTELKTTNPVTDDTAKNLIHALQEALETTAAQLLRLNPITWEKTGEKASEDTILGITEYTHDTNGQINTENPVRHRILYYTLEIGINNTDNEHEHILTVWPFPTREAAKEAWNYYAGRKAGESLGKYLLQSDDHPADMQDVTAGDEWLGIEASEYVRNSLLMGATVNKVSYYAGTEWGADEDLPNYQPTDKANEKTVALS